MQQKHESEEKRPIIVILCVLMTIAMGLFTITSAMSDYSLIKPYILLESSTAPVNAKLQTIIFAYNASTSRYDNATMGIRNEGNNAVTTSVAIAFYDALNTEIASAQGFVGTITPQNTLYVLVIFSWQTEKTVIDIASVKVTLIPSGGV